MASIPPRRLAWLAAILALMLTLTPFACGVGAARWAWSETTMGRLKTLWHRLGSPRWFFEISGPWAVGAMILGLIGIVVGPRVGPRDRAARLSAGQQLPHHVSARAGGDPVGVAATS